MTNVDEFTATDWKAPSKEQLALFFIQCRNAKAKFESKIKRIEGLMEAVNRELLSRMVTTGEEGFKVAGATVSRKKLIKVSCAAEGWQQFYTFLLDEAMRIKDSGGDPTQVFSFLHKRISSENVHEYMETHEGMPPPCINVLPEYSVVIRANNATKSDSPQEVIL